MEHVIDPNQRGKRQIRLAWQPTRKRMAESPACFGMGIKKALSNHSKQALAVSDVEVADGHDRFRYSLNTLKQSTKTLFLLASVETVWQMEPP
jgi:hypothetical protein